MTMIPTDEDYAYEIGMDAAYEGLDESENPFDPDNEPEAWHAWADGWNAAADADNDSWPEDE